MPEILPDCRPLHSTKALSYHGINWMPVYCANCGTDGGWVPEQGCNFAFYLCVPCSEKWQPLAGVSLVPDEVFWKKVADEMFETYGRFLTDAEIVEILKDDSSSLSKLCKDRDDFNQRKMS